MVSAEIITKLNKYKMSYIEQTRKEIIEAYVFLRTNNMTIPSETLEFMKDSSLKALDQALTIPVVVSSKTGLIKPTQLKETDLSKLREVCQNYIDFIDNDVEYHEDNDFSNYIFEQALEVIYGKDIWGFVNNRQD